MMSVLLNQSKCPIQYVSHFFTVQVITTWTHGGERGGGEEQCQIISKDFQQRIFKYVFESLFCKGTFQVHDRKIPCIHLTCFFYTLLFTCGNSFFNQAFLAVHYKLLNLQPCAGKRGPTICFVHSFFIFFYPCLILYSDLLQYFRLILYCPSSPKMQVLLYDTVQRECKKK